MSLGKKGPATRGAWLAESVDAEELRGGVEVGQRKGSMVRSDSIQKMAGVSKGCCGKKGRWLGWPSE